MAAAGVKMIARVDSIAGMGLSDPLSRIGRWTDVWLALRETVRRSPPDVALLVDAPELNLPLARILREAKIPVVYYIGPQVWAWRPRRLTLMKQRITHAALVLPFESAIYEAAGVSASFVGHPVVDRPPDRKRNEIRESLGLGEKEKLVAMLPGSRRGEVDLIAPPMLAAARIFERRGIRTLIAPGGGCAVADGGPFAAPASLAARDLLTAADAALVASGTASLEAALCGVPFAIVYKVSRVSELLARWLLDVPYVGLPNWVLGRREVDELLQKDLTEERLVEAGACLLTPEARGRFEQLSQEIHQRLGEPGASKRVAELVLGARRDAR